MRSVRIPVFRLIDGSQAGRRRGTPAASARSYINQPMLLSGSKTDSNRSKADARIDSGW